jgi:hypothetical protein
MSPVLTRRQSSPALSLLAVCLSAAIVAWGIQAKLSRYTAPTHSHPTSVAKLIQDEQLSKKVYAIPSGDFRGASRLPIDKVLARLQAQRTICLSLRMPDPVRSSIPFYVHAPRFRPPPSIA